MKKNLDFLKFGKIDSYSLEYTYWTFRLNGFLIGFLISMKNDTVVVAISGICPS